MLRREPNALLGVIRPRSSREGDLGRLRQPSSVLHEACLLRCLLRGALETVWWVEWLGPAGRRGTNGGD